MAVAVTSREGGALSIDLRPVLDQFVVLTGRCVYMSCSCPAEQMRLIAARHVIKQVLAYRPHVALCLRYLAETAQNI